MKVTLGSQANSSRARELSATRSNGPVGMSGLNSISALCPVYLSTS